MESEFERILKDEERILEGEGVLWGRLDGFLWLFFVGLAIISSVTLVVVAVDALDGIRALDVVLDCIGLDIRLFGFCFAFAALSWFAAILIVQLGEQQKRRLKVELQIVKAIQEIRERLDQGVDKPDD